MAAPAICGVSLVTNHQPDRQYEDSGRVARAARAIEQETHVTTTGSTTVRLNSAFAIPAWRAALKRKLEKTLDELSHALAAHSKRLGEHNGAPVLNAAVVARAQITAGFLGRVLAAWRYLPDEVFPIEGAGFASTVVVEDFEDGGTRGYTLMAGDLIYLDSSEVALDSPIGRALLGARQGDVIIVETRERRRTLRVVGICRLEDLIVEEVSKCSVA